MPSLYVPVVGRGDGPEPLLARGVPYLEFDLFSVEFYRPDFEVDAWKKGFVNHL